MERRIGLISMDESRVSKSRNEPRILAFPTPRGAYPASSAGLSHSDTSCNLRLPEYSSTAVR
jgi:hypothetical protein